MNTMRKHIVLVAIVATLAAQAQTIRLTEGLFSTGDKKEWRYPEYDDSGWKKLSLDDTWDDQGFTSTNAFSWYRLHFRLDRSLLDSSDLKEQLEFRLGMIDDCDRAYLNGVEIGRTGRTPEDVGGYKSAWETERIYKVSTNSEAINWDGDNVLAVRVYNATDPGGWYSGGLTIRATRLADHIAMSTSNDAVGDKSISRVTLTNTSGKTIKGTLTVEADDHDLGTTSTIVSRQISVKKHGSFTYDMSLPLSHQVTVRSTFTTAESGIKIVREFCPKYILTPKAPKAPRYNGPLVYGLRPGSPLHYRLAVSGERPMRFRAEGLPEGLTLDSLTGVMGGSVEKAGTYRIEFTFSNAHGTATQPLTLRVGNTIALTPPMGWSSWNCWGLDVSEERVMSSANAIIEKGLADYGYNYINVDDAWEAPSRNADGTIATNERFPDMKRLGDRLHAMGLKFGIYSSPGDLTCGQYLGSLGHEKQDAESYNAWGVDYLKYDWCGYQREFERIGDETVAGYVRPYLHMEHYLRALPRDIFYSVCQYGMAEVWKWGHAVDANSWRTTGDITDTWNSLYDIGFEQQAQLAPYSAPGHWNDPDMLIVGKVGWSSQLRDSRLTPDEQYSHITLWSLLAANMIIGCDMSQIDDFTLGLLCNNEVNAVNQDPLGRQAEPVVSDGDIQIWKRPLSDGSFAIGIFNLGTAPREIRLADYLERIGLAGATECRDLWRQQESDPRQTCHYPIHGTRMYKIK